MPGVLYWQPVYPGGSPRTALPGAGWSAVPELYLLSAWNLPFALFTIDKFRRPDVYSNWWAVLPCFTLKGSGRNIWGGLGGIEARLLGSGKQLPASIGTISRRFKLFAYIYQKGRITKSFLILLREGFKWLLRWKLESNNSAGDFAGGKRMKWSNI